MHSHHESESVEYLIKIGKEKGERETRNSRLVLV
jgi:hypothetical protein